MEKGRLPKSLYSPTYERFLVELRKARISAGMTQVEAAARLQRPQSFISNSESGERRVDVAEFVAFCRVYGADPGKIIEAMTSPHIGTSKPRKAASPKKKS